MSRILVLNMLSNQQFVQNRGEAMIVTEDNSRVHADVEAQQATKLTSEVIEQPSMNHQPQATSVPAVSPFLPPDRPVLNSVEIFNGTREVAIQHGTEFYRLRLTKSGKLILHK